MSAILISRNAEAQLQIAQWIRNGKAPTAETQNKIATLLGFAANVRAKQIFHSTGGLVGTAEASLIPNSLATRARWRFAFHTSPFSWFAFVRFEIAPQNNGTATDPYCRLDIANTANTTVAQAFMHGGSSPGSYSDVPVNFTGGVAQIVDTLGFTTTLTADTEYTGTFNDVGFARLHSASVWEVTLSPDSLYGYVANNTGAGAPIFDADRNDAVRMARLLHKRGGNPVFHWCSDVDSAAPTQSAGVNSASLSATLGALTVSATGMTSTTAPAYQAQSSLVGATSGDVTVSWPTHAVNDIAFLHLVSNATAAALSATEPDATWTHSGISHQLTSGTDYLTHIVYWRRATTTSEPSSTLTHPGGGSILSAKIVTYRGCASSGTPFEVASGNANDSAGTSIYIDMPSTTGVNELVIGIVVYDHCSASANTSAWANATLASVTERVDEGIVSAERAVGISLATGSLAAAGAMGTFTATGPNVTSNTTASYLALKP